MRLLSGAKTGDVKDEKEDLLKRMWLRRLPQRMRELVTAQTGNLDTLASVADALQPVIDSSNVASISTNLPSSPTPSFEQRMEAKFETLTAQLTSSISTQLAQMLQIAAIGNQPQPQQQTRGRARDRSPTPQRRGRDRSRTRNRWFCWYHATFGPHATKCEPPCNFSSMGDTRPTPKVQGNQ